MKLLGLDPGLRKTGFGIIESVDNRLRFIAADVIKISDKNNMADRLKNLHLAIADIIREFAPQEAAVEETFINNNPLSALKLGQARGVILLTPSLFNMPVFEYGANKIKKSIVGAGHADKKQVMLMVNTLLPTAKVAQEDAADALAVAICHAHHRETNARLQQTGT